MSKSAGIARLTEAGDDGRAAGRGGKATLFVLVLRWSGAWIFDDVDCDGDCDVG